MTSIESSESSCTVQDLLNYNDIILNGVREIKDDVLVLKLCVEEDVSVVVNEEIILDVSEGNAEMFSLVALVCLFVRLKIRIID